MRAALYVPSLIILQFTWLHLSSSLSIEWEYEVPNCGKFKGSEGEGRVAGAGPASERHLDVQGQDLLNIEKTVFIVKVNFSDIAVVSTWSFEADDLALPNIY